MTLFRSISPLLVFFSSFGVYASTFNSVSGHISSENTQSFVSISSGFHVQQPKLALFSAKTSSLTPDADGDNNPDVYEIDNDNDGLIDEDEVGIYLTKHNDPDSDMDDLPDGYEVFNLLDPLVKDANDDKDGDGFSNIQEFMNGTNPSIYALSLLRGWNLISLARIPNSNSPGDVFGDNIKGKAWHWEDSQFKVANEILSLKAYWVYAPASTDINIEIQGQNAGIANTDSIIGDDVNAGSDAGGGSTTGSDIIPGWLLTLIEAFQQQSPTNPPIVIFKSQYNGQTVYYIPVHSCCDQWSDLYDSDGNIICHPDGGISGEGDFNCTDFSILGGEIVWQDDR